MSNHSAQRSSGVVKGVTVFTNDMKLFKAVSSTLADSDYGIGEEQYTVEQETLDFAAARVMSASVYDLSLVDNDIQRAFKDLSSIKPNGGDYPLFLVGEKTYLKKALADPELASLVTRSFAKPVIGTQVVLALNLVKEQAAEAEKPGSTAQNSKSPIAKGPAAAVLALVVGLAGAYVFYNQQDQPLEAMDDLEALSLEVSSLDSSQLEARRTELFTPQISNLVESAKIAIDAGRILAPADDSALFYYRKALNIDRLDSDAQRRKAAIVDEVKLAFLISRDQQNFPKAETLLDLLKEIDPFNSEVERMKVALQDSKQRVELSSEPSAELDEPQNRLVINKVSNAAEPAKLQSGRTDTAIEIENGNDRSNGSISIERASIAKPVALNENVKSPAQIAAVTQQGAQEPQLLKRVEASYPRRAVKLDIQGWVELEYRVNEQGKPIDVRVISESPKRMFTKNAKAALDQWEYRSAKDTAGKAVVSEVQKTKFNFSLDN